MDMEKNGNISYTGHTANEEVLEQIGEEREREPRSRHNKSKTKELDLT